MRYMIPLLLLFGLLACQPVRPVATQPALDSSATIAPGKISRITFSEWAGPEIPVWVFVPTGIDATTAPVLIVMHGAKRDSERYLREWEPFAQRDGLVVIAPAFSKADFPRSAAYNLGNVFKREGVGLQDESLWSFSAIEPVFDHVVGALKGKQQQYSIYGHSAGSQFVHRYLYYKPQARVKRYYAANAGWYTLPNFFEPYPYGLKGSELPEDRLREILGANLVILLGDQDNDPDHESLRRTPEAMRQGPHRFARGQTFHEMCKEKARQLNVVCNWTVKIVPGVAHANGGMAEAAAALIE